jgi:hypothetical protein
VNSFITLRNNSIHDVYGRDREAITTDGGTTAFLGTIASINTDGTSLLLNGDPVYVLDPTQPGMPMVHSNWEGTAVHVMSGPGAGQWRRVKFNAGREWIIESTFTIPIVPGVSVVNIASLRAFHIWEDNTITDASVVQVFGTLLNSVVARNRLVRTVGFEIVGTAFPWTDGPVNGTQPCNNSAPATPTNCQWWQVAPLWHVHGDLVCFRL